jgi:hypothetical protein
MRSRYEFSMNSLRRIRHVLKQRFGSLSRGGSHWSGSNLNEGSIEPKS